MKFSQIRGQLFAIGTVVAGFVAMVLRIVWLKRDRDDEKDRADQNEARADQAEDIAAAGVEIDSKYSDLERESRNALKRGKMPDHLRDRNDR